MVAELFVPRKGLVVPKPPSYVKLDMAFGVGAGTTLFDKSRYRSHGAITGAGWSTGLHSYALDFDPTIPSSVEIPAASSQQLDFTSQAFSLIMRVRFDALTAYTALFTRGSHNEDGYRFFLWTNGDIRFRTHQLNANQATYTATGAVTTATWYTLGISRDGAAVKIFRNGVDITSVAGTHFNPTTCARAAEIGIYSLTLYSLDGKIEFLRVFGGIALSTSEHLAYHNALA